MILGVDPGLANVGWCLLDHGRIHSCGHIQTARSERTGDAAARLAEVMYGLSAPLLAMAGGDEDGVHGTACIEWPGGGFGGPGKPCPVCHKPPGNPLTGAQVAATAGAVYGAAYWLLRGHTERILTPAPVTWRAALARAWGCGRDEASVHAALLQRHPQLASLTKKAGPHVRDGVGLAEYAVLMTTKGPTR